MKVVRLDSSYLLTNIEKDIANKLTQAWHKVSFAEKRFPKPYKDGIYSISSLFVYTDEWIKITADSFDFLNRIELFRVFLQLRDPIQEKFIKHSVTFVESSEYPNDCKLAPFFKNGNRIDLLQSFVSIPDAVGRIPRTVKVDTGLLISNGVSRMLVYVDVHLPLNICITTVDTVIDGYILGKGVRS